MFKTKPKYFYKKSPCLILLWPFSCIYLLLFAIVNIRIFKPKKICKKLICVGNIVVGGSGKTPICCELCDVFNKHLKNICFISKGYGRTEKKNIIIPKEHNSMFSASDVGDEAMILSNNADVFIVNNRAKADCKEYDLVICDDGYFDKSIYKDCNIAIFDGNFFIGNGKVLPAGPIRNRLKTLKYADFVIITNPNENIEKQREILQKYIDPNNILTAEQEIVSRHDKQKTYFAFSGLGENSKFTNTLDQYGIKCVQFVGFEDHCNYNDNILKKLEDNFNTLKADKMITTEKDFVKLPKEFCKKNNVECLKIKYKIQNIDKIISFVIQDV